MNITDILVTLILRHLLLAVYIISTIGIFTEIYQIVGTNETLTDPIHLTKCVKSSV